MFSELIQKLNKEEIGSLGASLEVVMGSHITWFGELQKVLLFHRARLSQFCPSDKAHRACAFGKWYYAVSNEAILDNKNFIRLGQLHREMHEKACQMADTLDGDLSILPACYDAFLDVQEQFHTALVSLLIESARSYEDIDVLTGLPNRNAFDSLLANEISRVSRTDLSASLVLSDIDYFKQVNDTYGHSEGDRLLADIAKVFKSELRVCDSVVRYGGDEFIFILPATNICSVDVVINRIRKRLSLLSYLSSDSRERDKVTCSFGIVEIGPDALQTDLLKNVDQALYRAKHAGRDMSSV